MKKLYIIGFISFFFIDAQSQITVNIPASQDNTIYNENNSLSNGAGDNFTSGVTGPTNGNAIRRALIRFNLSSIPSLSTINSATLTLYMNKSRVGTDNVSLHKLTVNWGEGNSYAGGDPDGPGAPAAGNDATWSCSFATGAGSCITSWASPGGDFIGAASATTTIPNVIDPYNWSSAQMMADIQGWVNNASTNFGWILISNEVGSQTTNRFSSRTNPTPATRPNLSITYTLPIPVVLSYFKGQETNYGNILNWATAQESNNAFFRIEHSSDGTTYSTIGKVTGAGTTSLPQFYKFTHNGVMSGRHFYRLAQTDFDGKIQYSHIVPLINKKAVTSILINPNPVRDKILLPGFTTKPAYVIHDVSGRNVRQGILESPEIQVIGLPTGTYYLTVRTREGGLLKGTFFRE